MSTRNLGLVKAIFVQTTAPTNTQVLWYDTSLATPLHKYYDTVTSTWKQLANPITGDDSYRLSSFAISSSTDVVFSSVLDTTSYYVEVLEYIATDGTRVASGWTILDGDKQVDQFTFTPPTRYNTGTLWYKVTKIK